MEVGELPDSTYSCRGSGGKFGIRNRGLAELFKFRAAEALASSHGSMLLLESSWRLLDIIF